MRTITKFWRAFVSAMGVRKYIFVATVMSLAAFYGVASIYAKEALGLDLPNAPSWLLAICAGGLLLAFWLLQRTVYLEEQIEPKLEILFADEHPFSTVDPGNSLVAQRLIRIKVRNTSATTLESCIIKLEEFKDPNGRTGFFVPIGLITQHQLGQQRPGGSFCLRGGESKFVEVARASEPADESITLQYETNSGPKPYPNMVPIQNGPYQLRIAAYGGSTPTERAFRLFVEGGQLRMSPIAVNLGTRDNLRTTHLSFLRVPRMTPNDDKK